MNKEAENIPIEERQVEQRPKTAEVEKDIEKLHEQMKNAAEATLKPKDAINRDFVRSEATQQLFIDRQKLKDEGKPDEAKQLTQKSKKYI